MKIKKDWKLNDTVMPADLNRIEANIETAAKSADSGQAAVDSLKNEVNQKVEEVKTELNQKIERTKTEFNSTHVSKADFEAKAKELVKKIDSLDEEYVLRCYDTSGTITLPSDAIHNEIDVVCVGGGNGGHGGYQNNGGNLMYMSGAGGCIVKHTITVIGGSTAEIIIGAGGAGSTATYGKANKTYGGDTEFKYDNKQIVTAYAMMREYSQIGTIGSEKTPRYSLNYSSGVTPIHMGLKSAIMQYAGYDGQKCTPVSLPTTEFITSSGGGGRGREGYPQKIGSGHGLRGDGGDLEQNGKNAVAYGCGGGGGGHSTTRYTKGGDGKQGCVYIGYWRKKK